MARSYRIEDRLARAAQKERAAEELFTKRVNARKNMRREWRAKVGEILEREGFLDWPPEEFTSGLSVLKLIRELGLLSNPAEAERRLREPSGRSRERREDMEMVESVAVLASAAE